MKFSLIEVYPEFNVSVLRSRLIFPPSFPKTFKESAIWENCHVDISSHLLNLTLSHSIKSFNIFYSLFHEILQVKWLKISQFSQIQIFIILSCSPCTFGMFQKKERNNKGISKRLRYIFIPAPSLSLHSILYFNLNIFTCIVEENIFMLFGAKLLWISPNHIFYCQFFFEIIIVMVKAYWVFIVFQALVYRLNRHLSLLFLCYLKASDIIPA